MLHIPLLPFAGAQHCWKSGHKLKKKKKYNEPPYAPHQTRRQLKPNPNHKCKMANVDYFIEIIMTHFFGLQAHTGSNSDFSSSVPCL